MALHFLVKSLLVKSCRRCCYCCCLKLKKRSVLFFCRMHHNLLFVLPPLPLSSKINLISSNAKHMRKHIAKHAHAPAGGPVILPLLEKYGVTMTPADSEHSAIFQALQGVPPGGMRKVIGQSV